MSNQQKGKGIMRFRLPLKKLRQKSLRSSSSTIKNTVDDHHHDVPETCSEHSEDHLSHVSQPVMSDHSKLDDHMPFTESSVTSRTSTEASLRSSSSSEMMMMTNQLDILSADVQLQVFSFLDLASLRNMMATNRAVRSLLVSDSAYQVWHAICRSKFFCMPEEQYDSEHGMFLQDEFSLPIAVSPNAFCRYNRVNLPLLLSMTPDHVPTGIMANEEFSFPNIVDDDGSDDDTNNNHLPPLIQVLSDDEDSVTTTSDSGGLDTSFRSSSSSTISPSLDIRLHFNGNVGSGQVYSVKANHPLPKPTLYVVTPKKKNKMILRKSRRLLSSSSTSKVAWNPMVVPYNSLADAPRLIHVTPRLVSYFEISITAAAPEVERRPISLQDLDRLEEPRAQDCVVIGLATQNFDPRGTLPGWDICSFGYHSDNGGLYHGSGHARQRAESFGPGDTVGMGVDYVSKTIFVTKNGRFLGNAYDVFTMKFLATSSLYPVVGMDSKDTVHVNYGGIDHPFHFNLASYCHRQQQSMVPAKSRISTKFQFTNDPNCVEVGC